MHPVSFNQRFTLILIFKASLNGEANKQTLVTFHQIYAVS